MKAAHDLPHMIALRTAAVETAPQVDGGLVVITEGWRPPLHTDDAHTWCLAFDFRVSNILLRGQETVSDAAWNWVARMRQYLGNDKRYQFAAHGEGASFHIHAEFDPR